MNYQGQDTVLILHLEPGIEGEMAGWVGLIGWFQYQRVRCQLDR